MFRLPVVAVLAATLLAACNAASMGAGHASLQFSNGGATGVAVARSASGALRRASAERQSNGLSGLAGDPRLSRAAQGHASWMARNGQMSHVGAGGSRMAQRLRDAGYKACFAAENVAFGQPDDGSVIRSWMNSAGHRRNMLDGRATQIAVASATDGVGQRYWVMLLARPC